MIDVKLTVQAIGNHKALLNQFRQVIEKIDEEVTGAIFSQCVRSSMNSTCARKVVVPKVEELVV